MVSLPTSGWRRRAILLGAVAVAIGLMVFAFSRDSGNEGTTTGGGDAVEALIPAEGSEVLSQSTIGVDLAPGWTGSLRIDGQEVPDDELVDDRQQYQLLYQPTEGSALGTLPAGEVCAQATIYRLADGPERSRIVTWCFNVT